jgi:hypothetical protein
MTAKLDNDGVFHDRIDLMATAVWVGSDFLNAYEILV